MSSCMCGAEDCARCYPELNKKVECEPDVDVDETPYNASDPENEWMDFIAEDYPEPRGL